MNKLFCRRLIFSALLFFYAVFMAYVLFFKYVPPRHVLTTTRTYHRSVELVPFNQIYNYLSGTYKVSPLIVWGNLLGNIIIFIPLGIYFSIFLSRRSAAPRAPTSPPSISTPTSSPTPLPRLLPPSHFFSCLFLIFLASFSVELLQYLFELGASDVDDILLNCLGGLIGILIYRAFYRARHIRDL